jgi:hypothetical protein
MSAEDQLSWEMQYDNRIDSYASFFDHAWASEFLDVSKNSRMDEAACDLCRDWKGIALSSRMPWLMIESLQGFQKGFIRGNPAFSQRLMEKVANWVAETGKLRNMAKKKVTEEINRIGAQVQEEMQRAGSLIDREEIWNEYLQVNEFPWGTLRISATCIRIGVLRVRKLYSTRDRSQQE